MPPKQTLSISNVLFSGVETINDAIKIFNISSIELLMQFNNNNNDKMSMTHDQGLAEPQIAHMPPAMTHYNEYRHIFEVVLSLVIVE